MGTVAQCARRWTGVAVLALVAWTAGAVPLAAPVPEATPAAALAAPTGSPVPSSAAPNSPAPQPPAVTSTESADQQVSRILSLVEVFIGGLGLTLQVLGLVVSVILGAAVFLGWSEIKKVRELRAAAERQREAAEAAAEAARTKAVEASHHAEAAARTAAETLKSAQDELARIQRVAADAGGEIDAMFQELPRLEFYRSVADPAPLTARLRVSFEDADAALVLSQRLRWLADKQDWAAEKFVKVARYWRAVATLGDQVDWRERAQDDSELEALKALPAWQDLMTKSA